MCVRKENDCLHKAELNAIGIKADIEIVPNADKTTAANLTFAFSLKGLRLVRDGRIKVIFPAKKHISLLRAAPNLAPRISKPIKVKRLVKMMTGSMR